MSWMYQSNEDETAQLKVLIDGGPSDGFAAEVVRITKPLNVDGEKLAEMLSNLVKEDNLPRARKLVECLIPEERLAQGPKAIVTVLVFPLTFTARLCWRFLSWLWRGWKRFFDAVVPQ